MVELKIFENKSIQKENVEYCVNHPWRKAFTHCAECGRPFCYACLVEYKGKYYCEECFVRLFGEEAKKKKQKKEVLYSMASAVLLLLSFLIYVYFEKSIISNIILRIMQGDPNVISDIKQNYIYSITMAEMAMVVFIAIGAVAQLRWTIKFGLPMLVLIFGTFAYFGLTLESSFVVISVLLFISVLGLAQSKELYTPVYYTKESYLQYNF